MKVVPGGVRTGSVGGGGSLRKRSEGRVGRVLWQDCLPALFAPGKLPCLTGVIFALPRFDREGGFTLPCATAHGTGQCPTSKRGAKCNGLSSPIPVPIDWNSTNSSPRSAHRSLSRTRAPGVVGGIGSRRCAFGRARPRSGSAGTKGVLITRLLSPKKKIPTTRFRAQLLSPVVPVVPSQRPWATRRPRREDKRAPWTPRGRHAGRPSVQQARTTAMGCGAAQGTCAAGSPLARPWGRAFFARVGQARPPRTPPPRPADASRPASIAGGAAELALVCRRGAGHASGFGQGALRALRTPRPPGCALGPSHPPCVRERRRRAPHRQLSTPRTSPTLDQWGRAGRVF